MLIYSFKIMTLSIFLLLRLDLIPITFSFDLSPYLSGKIFHLTNCLKIKCAPFTPNRALMAENSPKTPVQVQNPIRISLNPSKSAIIVKTAESPWVTLCSIPFSNRTSIKLYSTITGLIINITK
eukprot:NODE_461_length_8173_cov_0.353604.p7 type:complete len:124 gc:universal NODE_461_length_8173_cov_0.353604:2959-3330(+)